MTLDFLVTQRLQEQMLEGTCNYLPNLDPATRLLFEEATITYSEMPKEELATYVTVEDYQYY